MTYIHYWGIFMPSWNILYLIYNIFQIPETLLTETVCAFRNDTKNLFTVDILPTGSGDFFSSFFRLSKGNIQLSEKRFYNKTEF